jgi:hypothetical protein
MVETRGRSLQAQDIFATVFASAILANALKVLTRH